MDAGLADLLFRASLALVLAVALAAVSAFALNRWLIARRRGYALVHARQCHDHL